MWCISPVKPSNRARAAVQRRAGLGTKRRHSGAYGEHLQRRPAQDRGRGPCLPRIGADERECISAVSLDSDKKKGVAVKTPPDRCWARILPRRGTVLGNAIDE